MTIQISEQDWTGKKPNKYRAKPVTIDGIRFASMKEAERYDHLKILQDHGYIDSLETQPVFPFHENGKRVFTYRADFRYRDRKTGREVVEDVKSPASQKNALYRLKKKLIEARHGIEVVEV